MGDQRLYNSIQTVVMPDGNSKELRVDITGVGRPVSKVELRLTDDGDASFLYVLHVSEADFNIMKAQQGLLVDFAHFPVHLVKLLEQCLNSVKGFLLMLEEGGLEAYLKVVQPIDLKNLCYIALRITRGSETEVMRHMRNEIIGVKTSLAAKEEECNRLLTQISQLQQNITVAEQQSENKIKLVQEECSKIRAQCSRDMDALREQLLQERKRALDSAAYQQENLKTKAEDLAKEVAKYKTKQTQACEKYEQAQQTIRELTKRNSTLEERQKAISQDLGDCRHRISELDNECRKKDQEIGQTHSRAEALDKEVARLRSRLSRQEDQLREADAEQVRLNSVVVRLRDTSEARSDLVLQLNNDLTKANLIIKERQKEMENIRSELKKLASSKTHNERTIANLELEMKLLRANAERDGSRIKDLEASEKKLQEQLKEAHEVIAVKDEQHKKNSDLINYLNRSLNRHQLDPSPPCTAQGVGVPPPLHMSAPSAPILYTMGSSLGRAGAGQLQSLHMSGPSIGGLSKFLMPSASTRPFSSTPLVASAASGGTGVSTRRSYPGAMIQPRTQMQIQDKIDSETPSRSQVDRIAFSQANSNVKETLLAEYQKQNSNLRGPNAHDSQSDSNVQMAEATKAVPINHLVSKGRRSEKGTGQTAGKENKLAGHFKPSAYFQPNKIRTDF